MAENANTIFADGPIGSPSQPDKAKLREWGTWLESFITAIGSNSGSVFSTRAALFADLVHVANSMAWVVQDSTAAYNGIYQKAGASGVGSWARIADLPYSFITAVDAGTGTPNAIVATSTLPISASALVVMNVFEANTASPVTVAFNGGSNLTIKTNTGNDVSPGGLVAGMQLLGVVSGSTFRIVNDQVSGAIVAAAEAAAATATTNSLLAKVKSLLSKLYAQQFVDVPVESATNLWNYSEQIDNAAWTKTSASITVNAGTAPDGTASLDKIVEASGVGNHRVSRSSGALVSGTNYTASFFVKKAERTKFRIYTGNSATFGVDAIVDLDTGTAVATIGTVAVEDWGGGFCRIAVTAAAGASSSTNVYFELCDASGNVGYNGNGTSGLFMWGAQFNADVVAGPYVQTVASSISASWYSAYHWAQKAAAVVTGNIAAAIHAATAKNIPDDADELGIVDSAASWVLKKITWLAVKVGVFVHAAATVASAATADIGAAASFFVSLTGTTTVTSLGTAAAGTLRLVQSAGILTLTNNANIILPTGANITTAAGDFWLARSEGAGVWRVVWYRGALVTADWTTGTKTTPGMPTPAQIAAAIVALAKTKIGAVTSSFTTQNAVTVTGVTAAIKRLSFNFDLPSGNGSGSFSPRLQVGGVSGFVTTGYIGSARSGTIEGTNSAGMLMLNQNSNISAYAGFGSLTRIGTSNKWLFEWWGTTGVATIFGCGEVTMTEELTQIRVLADPSAAVTMTGTIDVWQEAA